MKTLEKEIIEEPLSKTEILQLLVIGAMGALIGFSATITGILTFVSFDETKGWDSISEIVPYFILWVGLYIICRLSFKERQKRNFFLSGYCVGMILVIALKLAISWLYPDIPLYLETSNLPEITGF